MYLHCALMFVNFLGLQGLAQLYLFVYMKNLLPYAGALYIFVQASGNWP